MNYVEAVGKTREEAVEKALKELGAKLEDVTIDVEEQKSKGLFGFLAKKEVRVKVTLKETEKARDDFEDFSFASKGFSLDEDTREDIKVSKETENGAKEYVYLDLLDENGNIKTSIPLKEPKKEEQKNNNK